MAKGYALLVGLKTVDPAAYGGWNGENGCFGCELDVDNIDQILKPMNYLISVLKTGEATSGNVLRGLRSAAKTLQSGDIFVFYYAGHGGQQPDWSGDEVDGRDETLILYDREMIDDELDDVWKEFSAGVRIVMISDSCNSGTNYRSNREVPSEQASPIRILPNDQSIPAQMIHFSGCRDGGTSAGYLAGGAFTLAFCDAWANGNFTGNYTDLYNEVRYRLKLSKERQVPQYNKYGNVSSEFENSRPFSIDMMPNKDDIRAALKVIPKSWLQDPFIVVTEPITSRQQTSILRVPPLAAAAIGVAVGAGIQLTKQALDRSAIKKRAMDIRPARLENTTRPLPAAAAAFIAGVLAGSKAARKENPEENGPLSSSK